MAKRLKRSKSDRIIAGVCGGLGEYFNIDSMIIRIAWVLIFLTPRSPGILAYFICALILPEDDGIIYQDDYEKYHKDYGRMKHNTTLFIGLALVVVGVVMLSKVIWPQLTMRFLHIHQYWPVLLVIFGLYIIFNQRNKD